MCSLNTCPGRELTHLATLYRCMMFKRWRSAVAQKDPHTVATSTKFHHLQRPQNSLDMRESKQLLFPGKTLHRPRRFLTRKNCCFLFSSQWYRMKTNEVRCWNAKALHVMNMHNIQFDFFFLPPNFSEVLWVSSFFLFGTTTNSFRYSAWLANEVLLPTITARLRWWWRWRRRRTLYLSHTLRHNEILAFAYRSLLGSWALNAGSTMKHRPWSRGLKVLLKGPTVAHCQCWGLNLRPADKLLKLVCFNWCSSTSRVNNVKAVSL